MVGLSKRSTIISWSETYQLHAPYGHTISISCLCNFLINMKNDDNLIFTKTAFYYYDITCSLAKPFLKSTSFVTNVFIASNQK